MLLQAQDGDVMELGRLNRVNKKRKAEHTDSNERLSKRLSLLNLGNYIPSNLLDSLFIF